MTVLEKTLMRIFCIGLVDDGDEVGKSECIKLRHHSADNQLLNMDRESYGRFPSNNENKLQELNNGAADGSVDDKTDGIYIISEPNVFGHIKHACACTDAIQGHFSGNYGSSGNYDGSLGNYDGSSGNYDGSSGNYDGSSGNYLSSGNYKISRNYGISGNYERRLTKAKPDRKWHINIYDGNQNNNGTNSTDNWEEHIEELTPVEENHLDLSIVGTRNFVRFTKVASTVTLNRRNGHICEDDGPTKNTNSEGRIQLATQVTLKARKVSEDERTKNTKSEGKIQVRDGTRKRKLSIGKTGSADGASTSKLRLKQDFALVPLEYGRYGELMQRGPGGKPKYTDIASVIDQGTISHSNINTLLASKHNGLVTLDASKTWTAEKLYYVKPILIGTIHLEDLMVKDGERQIFLEEEARFVCANLFLALLFLRRYGIIHGNICPRKIVLSDKGYPYLGYFNTAERVGKRQSRPKEVIPIEYSSPEHTLSRVYSNTDEFGIAVVVYEMIFGRVPHLGENLTKTRTNLCNYGFTPEFDRERISHKGQRFLTHCLKGYHEERFNLLDLGHGHDLFHCIGWFKCYDEEAMFLQSLESPLRAKVHNARGRLRSSTAQPGPSTAPD